MWGPGAREIRAKNGRWQEQGRRGGPSKDECVAGSSTDTKGRV